MFFWRKKNTPTLYLPVKTDFHSHLIPGIDDGVKTIEESLEILEKLQQIGYQKIITTPHVMSEYYPNTRAQITQAFEQLEKAIEVSDLKIEVTFAAEYFMDESFLELLKEENLLTFGGNKVLIETSFYSMPFHFYDFIFQLKTKGYQPILAHPERYLYMGDEDYQTIIERGCLMQLNLLSLTGHYGNEVKKRAQKLLTKKWIHTCGSDIHRMEHLDKLIELFKAKKSKKILSETQWQNDNF